MLKMRLIQMCLRLEFYKVASRYDAPAPDYEYHAHEMPNVFRAITRALQITSIDIKAPYCSKICMDPKTRHHDPLDQSSPANAYRSVAGQTDHIDECQSCL